MLKRLFGLVVLSFIFCSLMPSSVGASTPIGAACSMRKYKIRALWQWFYIQIYDRPDGSGVWSPQWEEWVTYPSDGALLDEIIAWEGVKSSLQFVSFEKYTCDVPPEDPCKNGDCCESSCLECLGFNLDEYEFLIPYFPCEEEEECPDLNLTIRGTLLPARRGTARISGDWCKSLGCGTGILK